MVLRNSLANSHKAGVYTGFGISLGVGIIFALGLFGIGAILASSKWFFTIIKLVGFIYLVYLALKSIFADVTVHEPQLVYKEDNHIQLREYFKIGLICNLTNPKAYMFIISLSAYAVAHKATAIDNILITLSTSFATIIWFTFVAFIFGSIKVRKIFYQKQRIINICFGLILLYVASQIILM